MGELEQTAKRKRRRLVTEQILLGTLSSVALAGLVVAAPNAVRLLKYLKLDEHPDRDPRRRVSEAVSRLRRKGLVEWYQDKNSSWRLCLTEKGKDRTKQSRLKQIQIRRPKRWDGRWRFVMFDVPERQHALRTRVRQLIVGLGFYRFQDSVWVYPYDCEEIIAMLKIELGVGNKLLYVVADAVEYDKPLRTHFGL